MGIFNTVVIASLMDVFSEIAKNFGIHWQLLIIQSINFLCIVSVLYFFAFKPVLKTLDERKKKIEEGLKFANDIKQKLAETQDSVQLQMREAQESARQVIENAQQEAARYFNEKKSEAQQMVQSLMDSSKATIANEKAQMLKDLKSEVKDLVIDTTAKVLRKELSEEDRARYLKSVDID